jgi:hypothetical protein
MTPTEREALLKLWEEVPETRPGDLEFRETARHTEGQLAGYWRPGGWFFCGDGSDKGEHDENVDSARIVEAAAAAIARDAMVIWLAQRFCGLFKTNEPNGWAVWEEQDFGIRENVSEAETALLALIAACRTLTGRESA